MVYVIHYTVEPRDETRLPCLTVAILALIVLTALVLHQHFNSHSETVCNIAEVASIRKATTMGLVCLQSEIRVLSLLSISIVTKDLAYSVGQVLVVLKRLESWLL